MPSFADIAGRVEISGFTGSGAFTDSMMRAVFAQAYEGSARLRGRINFWLNDPVNVGRKIELKYDSSLGFAFTGLGQIFMNPNNSHTLLYITTNGEAVAHTPLSVLVHELGHAIGGVRDDPTYANLKGDNIDQFVNDWYDDLNIPKEVGYLSRALVSDNILIEGRDYTEGKVIANAIVDRGFQDPSSPVDTINTDFLGNSVVGPILFVGSSQVNDVTATGDDDFIYGGGGDDELKGEGGDDNLFGEEGGDFLTGGDGKDRIFGGDGNDYVEGGGQDDTLFGESGEDLIFGDGGKDYIDGGAGDDDIEGGVGDDTIHGGDGNDEVRGDSGADKLYGDAGDDTLFADGNDTVLNGGAGYDIVDYTDAAGPINWDQVGPVISKIQEIVGSTFDDNFVLPASLLSGYTGLDEQIKVQGAEGDDRILGNAADNNLDGGVGDDTLFGGAGDDTIVGGAGDDRIEGDSSALLTPNGNDQISGGSGDDIIDGQGGDDIIRGDQGNDRILGGDGADKIYGGTGNDILVGAVDEDELRGGSGNDILDAAQQDGPSGSPIDNTSSDQLWGGSGNDTFLTNNGDVINDPDRGDRIKFEGVLLTGGVETEEGSGVYEADNGFKYTLTGTDLLVEDDDFLTDSITIKNFTNGSAGIRLKKEDDEPDKDGAEEQRDPLIIDLNGDRNVITSMAVSNVYFDLDNDGFAERVAWAGSADGFLVRDLNGNGSIDDGSEMFGTGQTDEVAGSTQLLGEAGFVELSALDSNGDGAITALDVEFDTLRVWVDANGDAATDDGELVSLGDLGIVSIGLTTFKSDHLSAEDDTSIVTRASNALFADGATATVYDAYLSIDQYDAREILDPNLDLSSVSDLPRILGAGSLSDLDVAMARDAGLEELVRTFTQLNVSEIDQAHELVQKIVLRWTGGDAIDPEGRGANINARWLHAIEKLTGAGFEQAVVGTNPRADAASLLIAEWADLIDRTTAQLLGQTDLGAQFLPGLEFEAAAQFVAQEGTQLATLLENVASNAPAEFDSKLRYWKAVWGTLQQYTFALGVTDAELNSALDQELADQALNLTAEELGLAIFVGDASNFGVASRESVIGQAGYPGDRILIADGAETVLAGGQGNERFIVTSTVQSLLLSDSGGGDTLELNDWSREETVVSNELLTFSDNSDSGTVNASIGVELSNNGRKVVFQVNISDGRISSPVDVIQFGEASKTPLIDLLTNSGPIIVGGAGASHEFTGTSGDEFYIARSRSDLFTLASNTGDDVVIDSPDTGSPNDALFVDADPANVVLSASGSRGQNLKVQIVGGGSITFLGQFSDDASRVESVTFADGTVLTAAEVFASVNTGSSKGETLDGTYQDDVIDGQGGSDTLRGGYGTDRYVIRSGYGLTTISDGQGPIVVEFDGSVDRDNLEFSSADGNLNIVDTLTGDRVVVQGESASSATLIEIGGETIEPLRELVQSALLAGTTTNHTIYGTAASESLFGTDEKDLIVGNGGSDSLFGRGGNDTYHLSEGKVRIIDADFGFDTITVDSKYSIDDLTFVRQNGSQLIRLRIGGSDLQIDLRNRTATDGSAIIGDSDVEQIVFADGTSIDLTSGQVITGDSGDNILFSYATEFQVFAPGAGNDRIFALRNGHKLVLEEGFGHDEFYHDTFDVTDIEFSGIDFDDNVTFVRSGYDLVVSVTDNDTLTLKGIFEPLNDGRKFSFLKFANESLYLPSVIEQIAVSTDGDDIMFGRSDLDGGAGNDVLIGTRDVNNYRFGRGFGHDVIKEQDSNFGTNDDADTLTLIGLNQEDVDFLRDPSDPLSIIIRIRDTGETLTLDGTPFDDFEYNLGDGFSDGDQFGGHWIERIIFEDGSELTQVELEQIVHDSGATDGADTLFNFGTSNDSNAISPGAVLDGGLGNDTYANQFREINVRMTPGSGTDTVLNGGKLRVQVTVHLEGLEAANLAIYSETREGQRVTVLRAITGEEIVVEGGLNEADADGRQISIIIKDEAGQFFSASRQGALVSASNPTDGADLINGQSSSGGGGVDGLETPGTGGPVDDTFDPGEGDDVVFGRGGSDTLVFEKGDGLDRLVGTSSYRVTLGAGLNADDFTFEWLNDGSQNVLLSFNDSNDGIIVDAKQIEQILYDDGTQITFGEGDPDQFVELNSGETLLSNPAGDNVISSLAGGTIVGLSGASGQDTFSDVVFSDGVLEETPAGQAWIPNSILLQDASSLSEFEFVQDTSAPADLVIRNLATGSTMRVVGQFLGGNSEPIDPWSNVSMQPNGSPDWSSLDLNSDGVFDLAFLDTDNDGVPNWLSPDADGDGVSDWQADSETTLDVDGDGVADVIAYDDNEDGIYDAFDIPDSDEQFSDGIYFYDDDGDNEIDFYGTFFGDEFEVPRNADGSINWAAIDANQDGESDIAVIDLDGDGTPNWDNPDLDGDGEADWTISSFDTFSNNFVFAERFVDEASGETWHKISDHNLSFLVRDSDGDGIPDQYALDEDQDYRPDIAPEPFVVGHFGFELSNPFGPPQISFTDWSDILPLVVQRDESAANQDQTIDLQAARPGPSSEADFLFVGAGETIDGLGGNDVILASEGQATIVFGSGSGKDILVGPEGYNNAQNNTVQLSGISGLEEIELLESANGQDLLLRVRSTGATLMISGQLIEDSNGNTIPVVTSFTLADGTEVDWRVMHGLVSGVDTTSSPIVQGGNGGSVLDGGAGNDTLIGGTGDDIYDFGRGYDEDIIRDAGGRDLVRMAEGINLDDIAFSRTGVSGSDLLVEIAGLDRLAFTIMGQFDAPAAQIENFELADGTLFNWSDVQRFVLDSKRSTGDDIIRGFASSDLIRGGAGNDTIEGAGGNDVVDGETGRDVFELRGSQSEYEVSVVDGLVTVTDLIPGRDGVDRLSNVEEVFFRGDQSRLLITPENTAPDVEGISFVSEEDATIIIARSELLASATDQDGDALTLQEVNNQNNGQAWVGTDGNVRFRPGQDFVGTAGFDFAVADGNGAVVTARVELAITAINDAPTIGIESLEFTTIEDSMIVWSLPSNAIVDVDGDSLVVEASLNDGTPLPEWLSFDGSTFSGMPPENFNGSLDIELSVSDGTLSTNADLRINVVAVNDAPTVVSDLTDINLKAGETFLFVLPETAFVDAEGDALNFELVATDGGALPEWISVNGLELSGTAPQDFDEALDIVLIADDGRAASVATFSILPFVNTAPEVVLPLEAFVSDEDTSFSYAIPTGTFADVDGDELVLTATLPDGGELPTWLTFDGLTLAGNPPLDFNGVLSIAISASDGEASVSETLNIEISAVNDAPVAVVQLMDINSAEDAPIVIAIDPNSFADVDGDILSLSAALADGSALPEWLSFDSAQLTGTPPQDFNGVLDVQITANDGELEASSGFRLNITPVNDAPMLAASLSDASFDEDTAIDLALPAGIFEDIDSDTLSLSAVLVDGAALPDWLEFDGARFVGTPPADFNGNLSIEVFASDGELETSDQFVLSISSVNDAPTIEASIGSLSGIEDVAIDIAVPIDGIVDVDGDTLAFDVQLADGTALPEWLAYSEGRLVGIPPADFNGDLALQLVASDGQLSVADTFVLSIDPVNDAPVLVSTLSDAASQEDTAFVIDVPNDAFSDVDGDALSLSALLLDGSDLPTWLTFDGSTFAGTPPQDFIGSIDIAVTASDGELEASDNFRLTIDPVNDAPVVLNPLSDLVISEDGDVSFTIPHDWASDVDGDTLSLSITQADGSAIPDWLSFSGNQLTGTPPADWNGSLDLTLTASDGEFNITDTLSLTVLPVNDAPIAAAPLADLSRAEDQAFSFDIDANAFTDVDGDTLSLSAALDDGSELPGWLVFDGATLAGTPPLDFNGTLDIAVTASDGAESTSSTFTLTIDPVNDAPILSQPLADVSALTGEALTIDLSAGTFTDIDGDALSFSAALSDGSSLPEWLTLSNGVLSAASIPGDAANLEITVTASDGSESVSDTFLLEVEPNNTAPEANDDGVFVTTSNRELVIDPATLLDNDSDAQGDALAVVAVDNAVGGEVGFDDDGNIVFTPDAVFVGGAGFTYTVSDGELTAQADVAIAVDPSDQFDGFREGNANNNWMFGSFFGRNRIFGAGGNDRIFGGFNDDELAGGDGDDRIYGFSGNDNLFGGQGDDRLYGGWGFDTAHLLGYRDSYQIVTGGGFFGLQANVLDLDQGTDGDDGQDQLYSIEQLAFKGGETLNLASPIVLDLAGDGVQTLSASQSDARFDLDGDGLADDTSWIGANDAFLYLDRDGDGTVSGIEEISFVDDVEDAATDLAGLAAFDSNGDGVLNSDDERFDEFGVWNDADGDGAVDDGETASLVQVGIASIDLTGTPVEGVTAFGEVAIANTGTFTLSNGVERDFADAALTYFSAATNLPELEAVDYGFDRKAKKYRIHVSNGVVSVGRKNRNPGVDAGAGQLGANTLLTFKGQTYGRFAPVVLDLNGDGIEFVKRTKSNAFFDYGGDGIGDDTGWISGDDGFLVIDRNNDGLITEASELSLASEGDNARTGLQGLAQLDSNGDSVVDADDARFGELRVWQDRNGNGRTDGGELRTLEEAGIVSLSLAITGIAQDRVKIGKNVLTATSSFTRSNGTTSTAGDVSLAYRPAGSSANAGSLGFSAASFAGFNQPWLLDQAALLQGIPNRDDIFDLLRSGDENGLADVFSQLDSESAGANVNSVPAALSASISDGTALSAPRTLQVLPTTMASMTSLLDNNVLPSVDAGEVYVGSTGGQFALPVMMLRFEDEQSEPLIESSAVSRTTQEQPAVLAVLEEDDDATISSEGSDEKADIARKIAMIRQDLAVFGVGDGANDLDKLYDQQGALDYFAA